MTIAALGDLHLGPSERRDRFDQRRGPLASLHDHLESTHDLIVLVGDTYQADYGWRLGPHHRVREAAALRFPALVSRWSTSRYIVLSGNHDDLGGQESLTLETDGRVIHLIHGHQFDPISRRLGARLTMWIVARLRQLGLRRFCQILEEKILEALHRLVAGDNQLGLVRQAERILNTLPADVVVMGHSHRPACELLRGGVYANGGACHAASLAYVSIDTLAGSVELRRFVPNHGPVHLARELLLPS